uniref:Uncharacterized protein n=1 Tax=Rhizophora mucronata TaxID=61149 RepID=A0A2P2J2M1_RHIMU
MSICYFIVTIGSRINYSSSSLTVNLWMLNVKFDAKIVIFSVISH